ncbi:hypothetical protein NDU88_004949 [Pleurodeles waltl]|uniref:Uncharacterized protein n=1 Tax=Pleurodeles waltl TaxID=8319 RepID=A0AAV7UIG1_PLEWA|nr:hypothetical protein NDU88_004949 [Pleurodeles waltl]
MRNWGRRRGTPGALPRVSRPYDMTLYKTRNRKCSAREERKWTKKTRRGRETTNGGERKRKTTSVLRHPQETIQPGRVKRRLQTVSRPKKRWKTAADSRHGPWHPATYPERRA